MSALTLRIPAPETRFPDPLAPPLVLRLPAPRPAVSSKRDHEESSGIPSTCYKCSKPLPSSKWPWKRCLECRLEAERVAQQSTAAHVVGGSIKRQRNPRQVKRKTQTSKGPCVQCATCYQPIPTPAAPAAPSSLAPPLCSECHRLGPHPLQSSRNGLSPSRPSLYYRPPKRLKVVSNVERTHNVDHPRTHSFAGFPQTPSKSDFGIVHPTVFVPRTTPDSSPTYISPDWTLDRIIDKLSTAKHFNERGEYNFPQFLPCPPSQNPPSSLSLRLFSPARTCQSPGCKRTLTLSDPKALLCTECSSAFIKLHDPSNEQRLSELTKPVIPLDGQDRPSMNCDSTTEEKPPPLPTDIIDLTAPIPVTTPADPPKAGPQQGEFTLPTPPPSSRPASPSSVADGARGLDGEETEEDEGVPGWDSDLTELTETEESDSEVEVPLKDSKTPLRIKIPAVVFRKRKPGHVCQRRACQNLLTRSARWKMCLGCRIKAREYERAKKGGYQQWLKSDDEDENEGEGEASGSADFIILSGDQRKCGIKTCSEIIPPVGSYRWKLCEGCRARARRRARERKYGAPLRSDCEDDDEDEEIPLAKQLAAKRQIQSLKGLKLTFKGRTITNVDTRAHQASTPESEVTPTATVKPEVSVRSMLKGDNVQRVPLYQSFNTLLEDLHHLLSTYVKAHDLYVIMQFSNDKAGKDSPSMFAFNGEYSIVADPAGGDVGTHITQVQASIGQRLKIKLTHIGLTIDPAGIVTSTYSCVHEAIVKFPPGMFTPADTTHSPLPALLRTLSGELSISVSWDRSHLCFPGMRTVVGFCLVG